MRERLEKRLVELKDEFDKGQRKLGELESEAAAVRQTLLRISGAIQVLQEEVGDAAEPQEGASELSMQGSETPRTDGPVPVKGEPSQTSPSE
jgi:hypothetical protein